MPSSPDAANRTKFYLVRHADAGDRGDFDGPDIERPLTQKGKEQAIAIAVRLKGQGIQRVRSSPATRCVQTAQPLAAALGVQLEICEELYEGNEIEVGPANGTVIVAHGDNIPMLLRRLGAGLSGPWCKKGSVWSVTLDEDGRLLEAGYWANRD